MAHYEHFSEARYDDEHPVLTPDIEAQRQDEYHSDYPEEQSTGRTKVDIALREDVDYSQGGWATDTAASIMGLLFLISAFKFYDKEDNHLKFMFAGTAVAHLFGGFAHRFFPNRASDGVGNVGFYISMMLGYSGNCIRYGFGWGIYDVNKLIDEFPWTGKESIFPWIAVGNIVYVAITGAIVICRMEATTARVDDAEGRHFKPDICFGLGETLCSFMENIAPIMYLVWNDQARESRWIVAAVVVNAIGWLAVYGVGFLYLLSGGKLQYSPSLMQRVFHYCMLAMLWALDASVRARSVN